MRDKKVPVIKALPRINNISGFMFWCPWCKKWHVHGAGEGHRNAHCHKGSGSPFIETGYILKSMTETELMEIKRTLKEI